MTELTLDDAQKGLAAQPFSVLLGARVASFGNGAATLELDIREDLLQQNGYLHGGVLAYAADNAITFAAGTTLGPDVLTGGFSINYLRPAQGIRLVAEARVLHSGRRQATCRCDLYVIGEDGTTTLSAAAQGSVLTRNGPTR
ncbi:PaaI family thioesterase [Amycolatopsis japonica]|uniref:PaaI family thioesterase n=1 Tax=Amycolatopsis japonica TaxID=208439 RepID=UPI003797D060